MRISNRQAIYYLLKRFGWKDITLRTHCKHKDLVYNLSKNYMATDYWNLFDGMGYNGAGKLTFIQIKTNAWPPTKPINDFCKQHKLKAISVNVRKNDVQHRHYPQ